MEADRYPVDLFHSFFGFLIINVGPYSIGFVPLEVTTFI